MSPDEAIPAAAAPRRPRRSVTLLRRAAASRKVRLIASLGLLGLVIYFANWSEVAGVLRGVHERWLLVSLGLVLLDRLVVNLRWNVLLAAGRVEVPFLLLLRVQLGANFFGSFLPSSIGTDAIRIASLCRSGQPAPAVIAATLIDRISLIVATLLLGAAMLLFFAKSLIPARLTEVVLIAAAVSIVGSSVCLLKPVRTWVRTTLLPRLPPSIQHTLHEVADASLLYRHQRGAMVIVALYTVVLFALRIAFVKGLALATGVSIAWLTLLLVIPILWIIVMLPITIGGLGLQDVGYVALMAMVGIPAPIAVSISLLEHVLVRVANLPGVLFLGDVTRGRRAATGQVDDTPAALPLQAAAPR